MNSGTPFFTKNNTPTTTLPVTVPTGKIWLIHVETQGAGESTVDGIPIDCELFIGEGITVALTCGPTNLDFAWMSYVEFTPPLSFKDISLMEERGHFD